MVVILSKCSSQAKIHFDSGILSGLCELNQIHESISVRFSFKDFTG